MEKMNFKTEQESFWEGKFGDDYINRNNEEGIVESNINFFKLSLKKANDIKSCIEYGANIGLNLKALKSLYPNLERKGIEINQNASKELANEIGSKNVIFKSILDYKSDQKFDLVLIKTVLIHINPEYLNEVYESLYNSSNKYILICEYYNDKPTKIKYRGHQDKLFKRDFAGEMMKMFNLKLIDYGFIYNKDKRFNCDDRNWFLLKK
jgi:spore coat polysaccharide biosynthesis protein SpsF